MDRPLTLPDELVRAALEGRLSEIRVPVVWRSRKADENDGNIVMPPTLVQPYAWPYYRIDGNEVPLKCPLGVPGDRPWLREAWADADCMYQSHTNDCPSVVAYREDKSAIQFNGRKPVPVPAWDIRSWNWSHLRWRSSTQMPRWASRLSFDLLDIRVERLQQITEAGAIASGAFHTAYPPSEYRIGPADDSAPMRTVQRQAPGWSMVPTASPDECFESARSAYGNWWNRRYAGPRWSLKPDPSPWDSDPWVWVASVRIFQ